MAVLAVCYYVIVLIAGYAGLCVMLGPVRRSIIEVAGLNFCSGSGIVSLALFLASLSGFIPSRSILIGAALASVGALMWLKLRAGLIVCTWRSASHKESFALKVLFALSSILIAVAVANVAARVLTPGLADVDDFAIWMFKAKIVAHEPLRTVPAVSLDPALSFSHQDYPFGFPFLVAGMYAMIGGIIEQIGKSLNVPIDSQSSAVLKSPFPRRQNVKHLSFHQDGCEAGEGRESQSLLSKPMVATRGA